MKKREIFFVFISLLLVINLSSLCFAAVSEISSNQTFNFNLTKSGFENYYSYSWSGIESQTLGGVQVLTWEPNALAESIKIESSELIRISRVDAYIGANSIRTAVGSCAKCNVITKSLGKEEIVKKIVVSARMLKDISEITPTLGRDHVLQKERLSASFSDNKNITENEIINLGKISDFSLALAEKHNGIIGNISYSLTSTNPYIAIYFSDTNTTTTEDENADVIAEFLEQIRTDLSINSTRIYPTTAGLAINLTILNGGNNPASLIKVAVYVDDRFFEDRIIESIVQQERIMKDFIYTEDLSPGLHNLTIILDPENNTIDTDRNNNIFSSQINLPDGSPTYENEEPETPETFIGTKYFSGELDTELTKVSFNVDITGNFSSGNTLKITAKSNMDGNDGDCVDSPYVEIVSPNGATKRVYIFQGMQCTKLKDKCLKYWRWRNWHEAYRYSPYSKDPYTICTYGTTRDYRESICTKILGMKGECFDEVRGKRRRWAFPSLYCASTKNPEITKKFNITLSTEGNYKVKVGIEKAWDCSEQGYSYASQEIGRFNIGEIVGSYNNKAEKIVLNNRAFLFKKAGTTKNPVIIVLHGRGQDASVWFDETKNQGKFVKLALESGYAIIAPESINPNCPSVKQWDYTYKTLQDSKDLSFFEDIFNWINNKQDLNSSRIYIAGISSGGFMTSRLSLFYGTAKIKAVAVHSAGYVDSVISLNLLCFPNINDTITSIPLTHPKTLIIHGTGDNLVDYKYGQNYSQGLQNSGIESQMLTKQGGGHVWFLEYNQNILDWFK